MTLLALSALRPADIIVSTTDAAVSAVIRAGSGSSVSHSMLYLGGSTVVEAIDAGVQRRPLADALQGAVLAIALRRRNLTEKQRADVLAHAIRFSAGNLPYDVVGAAGAGTKTGRGGLLAGFGCAISLLFARQVQPKYATTPSRRTPIGPSSVLNSWLASSSWRARRSSKARLPSRPRATFALRPHFYTWASWWTRLLLPRGDEWPGRAARPRARTEPAAISGQRSRLRVRWGGRLPEESPAASNRAT